jgi:DNA-binding response OmpR family regulator
MAKVLVVEDEKNLNDLIAEELGRFGHEPIQALDGRVGLELFESHTPELVILDVMLPHLDGLSVLREIRSRSLTPVLMLTARAEELDRVLGLELGADDYVPKPFSLRELMARVKALLRRAHPAPATPAVPMTARVVLQHLDAVVDVDARQLEVSGREIELSRKEFDLLEYLVRHPHRVLTREWLLEQVWGGDYDGFDRTVDTHILRLRDKLGRDSRIAQAIRSVRGVGYRLEDQ